jgi:protein-L-isoaspartate O-methyltransferase
MSGEIDGTKGYAEHAAQHIERWERIDFLQLHGGIVDLLPSPPGDILDIGAGSGRDAAALAARGHTVVAVEPVDAFRHAAGMRHPSPRITWLDDSLPELNALRSGKPSFDVVMLTAVWMHLDTAGRGRAMPVLQSLLRNGGRLFMTLRHGSVPPGRHMFDVSADETIALARTNALHLIQRTVAASIQHTGQETGVEWTHLALEKRL